MNTETTKNANNNFDINTVQLGTKFERKSDKVKGELIQDSKGKFLIRFSHPKSGGSHTVPFSEKWQLDGVIETPVKDKTPVQDETGEKLLDSIIEQTEKKKEAKTAKTPAKDKTPVQPVFESLTDAEMERRKELEKKYKSLDSKEKQAIQTVNSTPFEKAKIIRAIQKEKLFKDKFTRFEDYAIEVLKIERAYATNLAQIGEFANITERFFERDNLGLSIKAANRFVRNQNTLADNLNVPKSADLSDFSGVLDRIISITGKTAKKEGQSTVLTPKVVDTVSNVVNTKVIQPIIENEQNTPLANSSTKGLLDKVVSVLDKKRNDIIQLAKTALETPVTPSNPLSECNHLDGKAEIASNIKGVLTLTCKCVFKRIQ